MCKKRGFIPNFYFFYFFYLIQNTNLLIRIALLFRRVVASTQFSLLGYGADRHRLSHNRRRPRQECKHHR